MQDVDEGMSIPDMAERIKNMVGLLGANEIFGVEEEMAMVHSLSLTPNELSEGEQVAFTSLLYALTLNDPRFARWRDDLVNERG